jgi:FkbM family methyltransferase
MLTEAVKKFAYGTIETATFGRGVDRNINGEHVRFPARVARFYPGDYEPAKQAFLTEQASGTVLDLGAHIGLYTVVLARRAERVYAFEPSGTTREILIRTLKLNGCHNVTVRPEVATSTSGPVGFHESNTFACNSNGVAAGHFPKTTCRGLRVDDLGLADVSVIKMDIEGAEYDALLGASRTMHGVRALALEVHPMQLAMLGHSTAQLWDLLADAGGSVSESGHRAERDSFISRTTCFEVQVLFR